MEISKRRRAVYLGLSGVCAVGAVFWVILLLLANNFLLEPILYKLDLWWLAGRIEAFVIFSIIFPTPLNPLAFLAVFNFTKGFLPAKRVALKISIAVSTILLGAYIAMVAFMKIDFVSVWPIWFACGLAPMLAAFGIMLFYGGRRFRRILCILLASLALCVSATTFTQSLWNNQRTTIGYSKSPKGTHRLVVMEAGGRHRTVWIVSPVNGLWYDQKNFEYASNLQKIIWLDEDTAVINGDLEYPYTITFKQGGLFS